MEQLFRETLFEGAQAVYVKTERFKTTRITIRFALNTDEADFAAFAAVPGLLRNSCAKYPSNMQVERKLASLYGASFSAVSGKYADAHILSFTVSAVADRFALGNECISEACTDFLLGALFEPDFDENGCFKEENLAREKRLMLEEIKAEMNDKMSYSLNRFFTHFFDGEGAAITGATPESVEDLRAEEVTKAWKKMLQQAQIMVCAVGNIDMKRLNQKITAAFSALKRCFCLPENRPHKAREQLQQVAEYQPLEQCKLNIGYSFASENRGAAKLFNMIFGGSELSKLSKVVREELSLCYYCSSSVGMNKKTVMVFSGIENTNREKALGAIQQQLEEMQRGNISEDEFELAKRKLKEAYLSFDTPYDITRWYLSQMLETILTPEQAWQEVEATSLEEVIAFAKTVRQDTIYSLGEKEE